MLLYKEFNTTEDWGKLIFENLLEYILKLRNIVKSEKNQESKTVIRPEEQIENKSLVKGSIEDFLTKISFNIQNNNFNKIDFWDRARMMLISKSMYFELYDTELYGNHDANICYSARKNWLLSTQEKSFLLKSSFGYSYDYRPCWYWFKKKITKKGLLLYLYQY